MAGLALVGDSTRAQDSPTPPATHPAVTASFPSSLGRPLVSPGEPGRIAAPQLAQAPGALNIPGRTDIEEDAPALPGDMASPQQSDVSGGLDFPGRTDIERDAPADPVRYLFPQSGRYRVRGWLDGGFLGNTGSPASKFNGPYNAVDRSNEPMFNQAYLINELVLPRDGSFGVGGRADLLYGEDFFVAQSAGFEAQRNGALKWNPQYYGLAIPQLYGEVGTKDVSVKLGHFYTIVGYESVMSVENFFYSHAYSYQFAGPFTHWGGLATAKLTDKFQVQAGLVNGWNALDRVNNRLGVLAGLKYNTTSWWSSFAIVTGDEPNNPANLPGILPKSENRTRYSYLLGLKPTSDFEYVFHHWLGLQDDCTASGSTALWYGIDQYAYYRLTDKLRVGGRVEWFRDEEGTRVGLNRPSNPNTPPFEGNFYSLTFGFNYSPHPNVLLRPEIRSDWFGGSQSRKPFQDGQADHQLLVGFDAILRF
jgi:hypothetical protein